MQIKSCKQWLQLCAFHVLNTVLLSQNQLCAELVITPIGVGFGAMIAGWYVILRVVPFSLESPARGVAAVMDSFPSSWSVGVTLTFQCLLL